MRLKIKPITPQAGVMYRDHGTFHSGDAGLDLFVAEETTFAPGQTKPIRFRIACEPENNHPYLLIPRSSIASTPLRMSNSIGLVDGGYRGELMAYCDNIKGEPFTVKPGQRLFQLAALDGSPIEFEIVNELTTTSRGQGGFGSTGG